MARQVTMTMMTIFIGSRIIFCLVRVFRSIDMLRSGTNPVIALQPINPMGELGYFHHLKQRPKEQKLTRKRTVERCDGNTNIVVIKAKKAKLVPDMLKIEIHTLGEFKCMICRNGRIKSGRLLLLSTRVKSIVRHQTDRIVDMWCH